MSTTIPTAEQCWKSLPMAGATIYSAWRYDILTREINRLTEEREERLHELKREVLLDWNGDEIRVAGFLELPGWRTA